MRWVLIDLDDTLVANAAPFRAGLQRLAAEIGRCAGVPAGTARAALEHAQRPGYRRAGFVCAALAAYWELAPEPALAGAEAAVEAAERCFDTVPAVLPGVPEALARLAAAGWRTAVWTMGDPVVQSAKLVRAGLHRFFERVLAVPRKDEASLAAALDDLGAGGQPPAFVLIGNSGADDIRPALALGGRAIWVGSPAWASEAWQPPVDAAGLTRAPDLAAAVEALLGEP